MRRGLHDQPTWKNVLSNQAKGTLKIHNPNSHISCCTACWIRCMQNSTCGRNTIRNNAVPDAYTGKLGNFTMNHSRSVFLGSWKNQWKNLFIFLTSYATSRLHSQPSSSSSSVRLRHSLYLPAFTSSTSFLLSVAILIFLSSFLFGSVFLFVLPCEIIISHSVRCVKQFFIKKFDKVRFFCYYKNVTERRCE